MYCHLHLPDVVGMANSLEHIRDANGRNQMPLCHLVTSKLNYVNTTLFLLHLFFKHTLRIGDGGLETNNHCVFIESRIFGWFPMKQGWLHIPDVPGHFECNNVSKEVPT